MRLNLIWILVALCFGTGAAQAQPHPVPDSLVADGMPRVPQALVEAASVYSDARSAVLYTWHPARREMLIGTRFAETNQIHQVAMAGGARKQLTFFADRVGRALFPPAPERGDHFVFSKDVGGGEFFQLYRYDLATGAVTLLTDGKSRNVMGVFSHAGDRVAYTSTRRNGRDADLYVVDPRDPRSDRRVAEVAGGGWAPQAFSPDGKTLLVQEYISVNESHLWLFDVTDGSRRRLTPAPGPEKVRYEGGAFTLDGKAVFTTSDRGSEFLQLARIELVSGAERALSAHIPWDVEELDLSRDGRTLAVVTNEDGTGVLRLFDARTGRERARPRLPAGSVEGITFHPSGRELGFSLTAASHPTDAFSLDLRSGKVERWTASETGGIDMSAAREPELVRWPSFDGRNVSGYLYRPAARFTGKRPVIISIHGGPEAQFRPFFQTRNRYYLDQMGVAILYPNVRGSTGYGKTFSKLDNGKLREDAVKDIGALLDWVRTRPELDPDRVMVMGGSYGGYMTLAVATRYADRIRCAIDIVGISHFVTFLERTEAYRRDLRRVEYGDERDPEMRAFLNGISPLTNAKAIRKPLFVVQGQNDPRVPVGEAQQIVTTVRKQGTPVWYLLAKDEGHGFAKKRNVDYLFYATILFVQEMLLKP